MPWTPRTFKHRNKGLTAPKARVASEVANKGLSRTGDEGRAIREANAVAKRAFGGKPAAKERKK